MGCLGLNCVCAYAAVQCDAGIVKEGKILEGHADRSNQPPRRHGRKKRRLWYHSDDSSVLFAVLHELRTCTYGPSPSPRVALENSRVESEKRQRLPA